MSSGRARAASRSSTGTSVRLALDRATASSATTVGRVCPSELTVGKLLYVLGELGHAVTAFDIPSTHDYHPVFAPVGIIPPSVPEGYSGSMDAAEITLHPNDPRTLYVSNRLELDASKANPTLPPIAERQVGDAVAVLRLQEDGKGVESVSFVRTNCDTIRAFQISPDGKYAAVAGQQNELVEVYEIGGDKHDQWSLVAKAPVDRVTDFIWL